jgi:putative ABC transport system permease protein
VERLRAIPGVQAASAATTRPFECCAPATSIWRAGEVVPVGVEPPTTDVRYADSSFFAVLRIPILAGQGFAARERTDGVARVVVNQTLARTLWPGVNAVGRHLSIELGDWQTRAPLHDVEIIGVVGDVRLADARTAPRATVYLSTSRFPSSVRDVVVRSDAPGADLIEGMRRALSAGDPALPLYHVTMLEKAVDESLARDRFTTMILTIFAIVAMSLAAVGIYGVFASEVVARQKELGVRIALGAGAESVILLVVKRALTLALLGTATGVVAGLLLARSMATFVYGVETSDPTSFAVVSVVLLCVGLLATLVPAIRAARISPLEAIRSD